MPSTIENAPAPFPSTGEEITTGVRLLRGDPRAAIRKLSGPTIVAMLLMAVYNLADAIWVAGLGPEALAGVGFIGPLFMILIGLSNGLGVGATSTIARRIGARDRSGTENAAVHALLLALGTSALLTVLFEVFLHPMVELLGAGAVSDVAIEYGSIVFAGTVIFLAVQMSYAILRAEGDTRRTMHAMAISSVLNMVLDPILIYGAGMGVAGAALATVISIASVEAVLLYWFFVKRDTYTRISLRSYRPDPETFRQILRVGLPACIEFLLLSFVMILNNRILVQVAGTDAVAIYSSGWRIVMFAIVPLIGIASSVVPVAAAAYGAREYRKIDEAHRYAIAAGVAIALITSTLTYLLAPQLAFLFTYTEESARLAPGFVLYFHTMCLFYPFAPLGMFSSSVFQGTGHGFTSLAITIVRNLILIVVFAYALAVLLGMGALGVYLGIVLGNTLGGLIGYLWARAFISRLLKVQARQAAQAR